MRQALIGCLALCLVACAGNRDHEPPPATDADTGSAVTPPPRDATRGAPFLVRVDEVECPRTVPYGEALVLVLQGTIGNDGCHHLHEVRVTRPDEVTVVVEPYGIREGGPMCTQVIVPLLEEVVLDPLPESDFTVEIRRGNGEPIRIPVTVER